MHIRDTDHGIDARLNDPSVLADPYPLYAQLRSAAPLVRCHQRFVGDAWMITRYDEVTHVLKDAAVFNSNAKSVGQPNAFEGRLMPELLRAFMRSMLYADGLDHKRLRGLASKAFTPARVEDLRERIESIVTQLLDEAEREGTFDFISRFALPLPLRIISELLGIEAEQRDYFHRAVQGVLDVHSLWALIRRLPTYRGLRRFFERMLARKRRSPSDDLTSALIAAEEEGERLSSDELMGMIFLLLFAGHETTVNLLGNGTLALLENPEQLERVQQDPALIPSAIEEMLRYYSPVQFLGTRYVSEPVEVGGVALDRGDKLLPLVAAANRDKRAFEAPDDFDVGREPNRHLSFGAGRHFCIGAHLSRLEATIAFTVLFERFPRLRLAVEHSRVKWSEDGSGIRGLQALPVTVL